VDIGGTFTDVALAAPGGVFTAKVLTTPQAPEEAVMAGVGAVLEQAGLPAGGVEMVIHGTTLATNAIIERKGARTAMLVTEGFRDAVEMAYENRFEQYDINVERPVPLVPRHLRLPVRERMTARGEPLLVPLPASVEDLVPVLETHEIESVAVAFLHAYANPAHEQRVAEWLTRALPDLWITLSSEVCPEIREYERMSTTCANAYVQPLMAGYLRQLETRLGQAGVKAPLLFMTSGGGLATVATTTRHPIRLVESGPAGGAILASRIARQRGLDRVLSFDMGGTTAKICLIDDGRPQTSRVFEVDRAHRFTPGSGLPLRIPVIEMVEIGAGGGSVAAVDGIGRLTVGPESAGAQPGPACYGQGGERPTVTDADVLLGRIDPRDFAGGRMDLDAAAAGEAVGRDVGESMGLDVVLAALSLSEIVDENMANAARVHAVERGKAVEGRSLVAFGGAAPLHASRLAEKLGIGRVLVPPNAGVGSAVGFLDAPIAYEVVRSHYERLGEFDHESVDALLAEMRAEAERVVRLAAPDGPLDVRRIAYMRYVGQGHEVDVDIGEAPLGAGGAQALGDAFDAAYASRYGRTMAHMDVEVLTWALTLGAAASEPPPLAETPPALAPVAGGEREVLDTHLGEFVKVPVHRREELAPGACIEGPAVITEAQTTIVVSARFDAHVDGGGYIVLEARRTQT
jgi:N-methylhydantoinase A